tara:strand:+ start:164866 stop:165618 length:753 start_codon:yes stop_codon:yes gene_type:complete
MLIVISPAKKLNEQVNIDVKLTEPKLIDITKNLHKELKNKTPNDLKKLMGISDNLAELNVERFQSMQFPQVEKALPAALMFNGDTYTGLEFPSLSKKDQSFAQDHLRILSGLYGILRPFDKVQPYRLEMGTRLKTKFGNNLYDIWKEKVTSEINNELTKHAALINLSSNEYFSSIDTKKVIKPIITPVFKEERNGKLKIISFNAKKARGLMSRYIITQKLENPKDLLEFDLDNYQYSESESKENQPTFIR